MKWNTGPQFNAEASYFSIPTDTLVNERTSILALAYMPPDDSDDEVPNIPIEKTVEEEEHEHDMEELADYNGDSDDEGLDAQELIGDTTTERLTTHENDRHALINEDAYVSCDTVLTDDEIQKEQCSENAPLLTPGAPPGWRPPCGPADWKEPAIKAELGQPTCDFKDIDNPGGWSKFTYRAKFQYVKNKAVKHLCHSLPTGCKPVPANGKGERVDDGYNFFYNGWTRSQSDPHFRSGATRDNLFSACRRSSLDGEILSKLGLTKERMLDRDGAPDSLFFYNLLLPVHDTADGSTVEGDPRKPYYPHVATCTEIYAITDLKLRGSGRGHRFKETSPQELLKWDGVTAMDGVLGGSRGAILRCFDIRRKDNVCFNKMIYESMSVTRWLEIKRAIKLNNNLLATKFGEPGHDPCQKRDYIYNVICHNTNALTKKACLDLCGEESTWLFGGWAGKDTGVIQRNLEKPGGSTGGQLALVTDVDRVRVRAYIHRHKLHPKYFGNPGENEIRMITDKVLEMVADENNPRGIFSDKPHMTWDNYFSGDNSMNYCAEKGVGFTCTVQCGRLPGKVKAEHLHKLLTKSEDRPKAARFENPVVLVKRDKEKWGNSVWVHTSFQSTSSCNIAHVNAINSCSLFAATKERGRNIFKRSWAIEMNESRQLYLAMYGKVDRIDHLIKNCNLYYR